VVVVARETGIRTIIIASNATNILNEFLCAKLLELILTLPLFKS
jgi:hypothetical protein